MSAQSESETGGVQPSATPAVGQRHTVLVVENDDNDAELLRLMFKRSNILNPLKVVETVQDAVCYLQGAGEFADRQAHPFPILLLLDSHLSDGSGFDVLRWLRANQSHTPRAVVMLTGSDINAFKASYDHGAHSFLTKPLKFDDFKNMIAHVRGIKLTSVPAGRLIEPE